jgi:hypothetical protein
MNVGGSATEVPCHQVTVHSILFRDLTLIIGLCPGLYVHNSKLPMSNDEGGK